MEGKIKRSPNVARPVFCDAVFKSHEDGTGIDGIAEKTGLAKSSVNTRLANLKKQVGAENVPSFKRKGGNTISDSEKETMIAILKGQAVQV